MESNSNSNSITECIVDDEFFKSIRSEIQSITSSISGLTYITEFITKDEQEKIINELYGSLNGNWESDNKRRVQQYGYRFSHADGYMDLKSIPPPIPEILFPIMKKLVEMNFFPKLPDQVIINEYEPGQGIGKHVDRTHCFDEPIASVSLLAGATMEFRHRRKDERKEIFLEPCSLVVMKDKARYMWTHAIPIRDFDEVSNRVIKRAKRISLTFRIMKEDFVEIQLAKQQQKK